MTRQSAWWTAGCAALAWLVFCPSPARAQTQSEATRQAEADFKVADEEMAKVYKELSGNMKPEDLEELKEAQRAWLAFRDAQAKYKADLGARGGSLRPTIYAQTRETLTRDRTSELQHLLNDG